METIENKVAASGLITLDLEQLKPEWQMYGFDMAQCLEEGLLLREKAFRTFVEEQRWSSWKGRAVYIHCTTDAIVPTWAYMLLASAMEPFVDAVVIGDQSSLELYLWRRFIQQLDPEQYRDKRLVIKGCSDKAIPETIYVELTTRFKPVVKSLMFGEPCSTVPLYKAK